MSKFFEENPLARQATTEELLEEGKKIGKPKQDDPRGPYQQKTMDEVMEENKKIRDTEAPRENPEETETKVEGNKSFAEKIMNRGRERMEKGKRLLGRVKNGLLKAKDFAMKAGEFTLGLASKDTLSEGINRGADAVARGGKRVGEAGKLIVDKTNEKFDAVGNRIDKSWGKLLGGLRRAKNKCFDTYYLIRINRLQEKEDKKRGKLEKLMREKINPLKERIDSVRSKKEDLARKLSFGSPDDSYASSGL